MAQRRDWTLISALIIGAAWPSPAVSQAVQAVLQRDRAQPRGKPKMTAEPLESTSAAFTVGYNLTLGAAKASAGDVVIATTLLGSIAGAAFEAVGSTALKKYLEENLAAGTGIPSGAGTSLTGELSLSLGEIPFVKGIRLLPAINIQQTDTADVRTPRDLAKRYPSERHWSALIISAAIDLPEGWLSGDPKKRAPFIPVIGVRVPHYFPGDPFNALAALFSTKRNDFVRSGDATWRLGVEFPLRRIGSGQ